MLIECEHDLASEVRRGDGQKNIAASNDVGRALDGVEGPTGENRDGRIGVLQVAETAGGGQRGLRSSGCTTGGIWSKRRRYHQAETCSTRTQSEQWRS